MMNEFLILALVAALVAVPMVLTGRKRQQQVQAIQEAQQGIVPGSRVVLTSGLHATVVSIGSAEGPDTVVLDIAPGVHTVWERAAIMRTISNNSSVDGTIVEG